MGVQEASSVMGRHSYEWHCESGGGGGSLIAALPQIGRADQTADPGGGGQAGEEPPLLCFTLAQLWFWHCSHLSTLA